MKSLILFAALIVFSLSASSQVPQPKADSSKKFALILSEAQINELFYVVSTSGEISANEINKYLAVLTKQVVQIPREPPVETKPDPAKKPKK